MTKQAVLMVGHGSRVPQAIAQFHEFADALADRLKQRVERCFLELADPDMATGIGDAAHLVGKCGEVVILPLFLGGAGHQKNDVASAVQWARSQFPDVTFRYAAPLGFHAKLIEVLDLRVRECLEAHYGGSVPSLSETAVLVVGRGSSDPNSNGDIAKLACILLERRPYLTVEYAFQAVARPKPDEGVRRCHALGAKQVIVAPFVLFTGKVIEDIRAVTLSAGEALGVQVLQARYLEIHPLLLDVAEQRLREAIEGTAAMNCDLCKYRFPMAGYEHQVSLPQVTHHLHGGSSGRQDADHTHVHHHEHDHHEGDEHHHH